VSAADRSFRIDNKLIHEAYKAVRANAGSAGVDGQTIEQFEAGLGDNLHRLWNRMSSGSYFPPPVRVVAIPKKNGGQRLLGVPTVADRMARMVVKRIWRRYFWRIPMATVLVNRRSMALVSRESVAGHTTGFWNSTSRACSTTSTTRFCRGWFEDM
jgi:hypothetical protein